MVRESHNCFGQINVYSLGKTYLQLSRALCINIPAIGKVYFIFLKTDINLIKVLCITITFFYYMYVSCFSKHISTYMYYLNNYQKYFQAMVVATYNFKDGLLPDSQKIIQWYIYHNFPFTEIVKII